MKIAHIMLACFYIDGFSYQENLLPKYHKKAGHNVKIIASQFSFDQNGNGIYLQGKRSYTNEYGIPVVRLEYAKIPKAQIFKQYQDFGEELEAFAPDAVFVHGLQFLDFRVVLCYVKRHPGTLLCVDNHADFHNSARNWLSKSVLHKGIWKHLAQKSLPFVQKFFGVTPARVDFLKDVYRLPAEKVALLPLGADDDAIESAMAPEVRAEKRAAYGLSEKDFVLIAGGKIDQNKPQIITLMRTINECSLPSVKLLIFGSVTEDLRPSFESQISSKVQYIGWKKSEDIYGEFAAADLVLFPGLHSVLWEQAVAMGKPCIFKNIDGFHHIDIGGNCLFFESDDAAEYQKKVETAIRDIAKMRANAQKSEKDQFLYSKIAKAALE